MVENLSGGRWSPAKQWNRVHGDTKSSTGGAYHIETIKDSNDDYRAKVVGATDSSPVTIAEAGAAEPSFQDIVDKLKAYYA